jgi:SAM-dependent methyltransferase
LTRVAAHYERLLADHYTWMTGSFAGKVAEQKALLAELGVAPDCSGRALDLGCGSGFQSVALAELGFAVTALDSSAKLLAELETRKRSLPIVTKQADIAAGLGQVSPGLDVIVCMGDTLTHLDSKPAVIQLFTEIRALLAPGGKLVLSFRDLTTELAGLDRFILIRADAERVLLLGIWAGDCPGSRPDPHPQWRGLDLAEEFLPQVTTGNRLGHSGIGGSRFPEHIGRGKRPPDRSHGRSITELEGRKHPSFSPDCNATAIQLAIHYEVTIFQTCQGSLL